MLQGPGAFDEALTREVAPGPLERLDEHAERDRELARGPEGPAPRHRLARATRGDASDVVRADAGRGVEIFLWGLPPAQRLPLRAYQAGFTLKNGVPINYIEAISLFEWVEVGFNTFYAYRDGETAWIYAQVLRLLHQRLGSLCISVYPYQIGKDKYLGNHHPIGFNYDDVQAGGGEITDALVKRIPVESFEVLREGDEAPLLPFRLEQPRAQ